MKSRLQNIMSEVVSQTLLNIHVGNIIQPQKLNTRINTLKVIKQKVVRGKYSYLTADEI